MPGLAQILFQVVRHESRDPGFAGSLADIGCCRNFLSVLRRERRAVKQEVENNLARRRERANEIQQGIYGRPLQVAANPQPGEKCRFFHIETVRDERIRQ